MMNRYLLLALVGFVPFVQAQINCEATYRYFDGSNWQTKTQKLEETYNAGNIRALEAQRSEAYYSVNINTQAVIKHKPDITLTISLPPNYLYGTTSEFSSQNGSSYLLAYSKKGADMKVECNKP
ncbi:hypothetical protein JQC92_12350 [Shewanella sp. 202IG2-18]|uniref:hypothetical protein n=1 Tax=Parashewanella hymeniacidonis TaxID=2807618 RepID=UPI00195F29E5|nr:hypothetical protein [Parashewanella hymeniacidonis]MBM7072813.1 hypothetical protein [Parashewanella hymeniacidonis]